MQTIGITGGIGSGKSIICRIFYTLGIPIYTADERAKHLTNFNPEIRQEIISLLGSAAYNNQGYNRKYVAQIVFEDPIYLKRLNQIIHPLVAKDFLLWRNQHSNAPYGMYEAAILFESGFSERNLANIVVDAPLDIRIRRIEQRDGSTYEEIMKRVNNQWSADKLRALADWVIENDDKKLILPQILKIHHQILQKVSQA